MMFVGWVWGFGDLLCMIGCLWVAFGLVGFLFLGLFVFCWLRVWSGRGLLLTLIAVGCSRLLCFDVVLVGSDWTGRVWMLAMRVLCR